MSCIALVSYNAPNQNRDSFLQAANYSSRTTHKSLFGGWLTTVPFGRLVQFDFKILRCFPGFWICGIMLSANENPVQCMNVTN